MSKDFLILYGSETNQSESIADQIYAKCIDMKLDPRVCRMDEVDKEFFIEKETLAVVVVSSTGDGDPPENAHKFFKKLSRNSSDPDFLKNLEFGLLGLGDSNYSTFQGAPKKLEKLLLGLGARKVLETGAADDQVGLELIVEPWCEKLYEYLAKRFECNPEDPLASTLLTKAPNESSAVPVIETVSDVKMDEEESNSNLLPHLGIEKKEFPSDGPCLIRGSEALISDENLRVPVAPQAFLSSAATHIKFDESKVKWQNGDRFPGQFSEPISARVVGVSEISPEGEVRKPKRSLEILITEDSETASRFLENCDAGDSVYFVFPNPKSEVDFILQKLSLLPIADQELSVQIDSKTEKRDPKIPAFIPNPCSLRYILTYCFDFRRAPGRPLLRIFAEHAKDEKEKRRLLELCSAQGVQEFTDFVRQAAISLVDLMIAFPSSVPPIDRIIELLPRLIPRPYSVSNHQSRDGKRIRFVYSLLNFEATKGVQFDRFGVCSSYLRSLQVGDYVKVILKEPSKFRLPPLSALTSSTSTLSISEAPLILIGPGTGVAPFVSFFQKLLSEKISKNLKTDTKRYLFYGSADLSKEYIFKDELESLNREGIITDLILCESRPESGTDRPKYVQDALKARGKEITELVFSESSPKALIFACGDAKGMSKDLWACFQEIFQEHLKKDPQEVLAILKKLKDEERYIEDVWS
ncbi:hypothetical protein FO519_008335 [Halicephalobus sp. NKZ332]|nr:hypothetical protein FO519_008335 [Halicephalobus sp. NKZ332]